MKTETVFEDKRLLEALDYIDRDLIAEAMGALKITDAVKESVPAKRTPFKHWRQFAAMVACLLLLSFAVPALNKVVEIVSSFSAGWGSGTTEESLNELINENTVTEIPDTTNGMYDEYILTEEDLERLNEAFFRGFITANPESFEGWDEKALNEMRESKYCKLAETIEQAMSRPTERPYDGGYCYIGKYGDCIVYITMGNGFIGYPDRLIVCHEIDFYSLETACKNSWISAEELEKIYEFCSNFNYYNGGLS